jgi:hypothetical protein
LSISEWQTLVAGEPVPTIRPRPVTQQTTNIHPGHTFDRVHSLMQIVPFDENRHPLLEIVSYGPCRMTVESGPTVNPIIAPNDHCRVNAIGPAANILLRVRQVVDVQEFASAPAMQGHSLHISGPVTF